MEGYEHVQRVRSRGLKTADLSYQGGRPNIRPTDKLKRPPSRLSNPIECASRQQVLRERTGGCSPDEYDVLMGVQRHRLVSVAPVDPIIFPFERNGVAVERDQPAVGDGDTVRVARQIGKHHLKPTEWALGI